MAERPYQLQHPVRFVTAASLFDGHDVSINIMRRILQASGAEVVHLGHNRSVDEVVTAALQEDVQAIAVSSYQGGHNEYFRYALKRLREQGGEHIKVFGGGGGVITHDEIKQLQADGVSRIYAPADGQHIGLQGIINDMLKQSDFSVCRDIPNKVQPQNQQTLTRIITALQQDQFANPEHLIDAAKNIHTPILGITGTGGAGKSSLTDELIQRFLLDNPAIKIAIIAIDPTRRKTGGALLGDRIRMNAIHHPGIFFRSLATREAGSAIPHNLTAMIAATKLCEFDLIIVETPGIGQGDASITPFVDTSLYVMTPEFGASSQLEKIDMLDYADIVAINKFDRKGAEDALRDVRKQMQRNQQAFSTPTEAMPVYGTIAAQFNDDGVTALYHGILNKLGEKSHWQSKLPSPAQPFSSQKHALINEKSQRYLAEIADTVRAHHQRVKEQADIARQLQHLRSAALLLQNKQELDAHIATLNQQLQPSSQALLDEWKTLETTYRQEQLHYKVRDKDIAVDLYHTSLAGSRVPKVALPKYSDDGDKLSWLGREHLPGYFPYTAGIYPFKRQGEEASRLFAGEGDAFRTNKRFKLLSENMSATRLSTAFDSVTLYGFNPAERPDIYGKIGNSGVSIATLEDMKALFAGFDLCAPTTSVSMTINGPAPTLLAFFLNTAIDQQVEAFYQREEREPSAEEHAKIKDDVLHHVRGTVQADILKEDQAQNTCIFSTEFSLKMMVDVQEYFVAKQVRNFYSVSISGYHIAEAGANPISQLAFTLSNGFTYVEAYLARGMHIDEFAPNLSFFFSNGMDVEYSVMGRVARRIWAVTMRDKYGANSRSQKLKYHVQTSGRSLHAQEMSFNDIRTTLEALIAFYDNCQSLHTNAYDEAITTPTEESVRRALAIQVIIQKEWGLAKNENPLQGAFIIDELTNLVEEAVLKEFEAINSRGGVLGAMETGYQRSKIQEESMYYEAKKHDGSLPLVGVNTFLNPDGDDAADEVEQARSTDAEKQSQLQRVHGFEQQHQAEATVMLEKLKQAVINDENVFTVLMDAARVCSLGQISALFFEVGGRYRRNM